MAPPRVPHARPQRSFESQTASSAICCTCLRQAWQEEPLETKYSRACEEVESGTRFGLLLHQVLSWAVGFKGEHQEPIPLNPKPMPHISDLALWLEYAGTVQPEVLERGRNIQNPKTEMDRNALSPSGPDYSRQLKNLEA